MSKFPNWFTRAYKQWSRSQPGEEDFLAFCDLLGYSPAIVLNWLQGDSMPQGAEILSIAGVLGTKVYEILGQAAPDPELVKIYNSFSHLKGEFRGKLAQALYEVEQRLSEKKISVASTEAKAIIDMVFMKHGLNNPK
jgi:transcriptional regulator with XRE-family HTH domain